eukprot:scaffold39867_cov31-Attheya_sp.AAC.2
MRYNTRKNEPTTSLLQNLAKVLPQNYIHVPRDMTVQIDEKPIRFNYWPRRLVELSKFTVKVNKTRFLHEFEDTDTTWRSEGYPLNIYAGFDCSHLGEKSNSGCRLYIYSRRCGRLITSVNDGRHLLKLPSGGNGYAQGLTIIVDDSAGHLPLTPSKQDIAFSDERDAAAHEDNFYAWISAVAKMFWHFHANTLGSTSQKTRLAATIREHKEAIATELLTENAFSMALETAAITCFKNVPWTKRTIGTTEDIYSEIYLKKKILGGLIASETSYYFPGVATKCMFDFENPVQLPVNAGTVRSPRKPKTKKRKLTAQIGEKEKKGPSDILNGQSSPSRKENRLKNQLMSSVMDSDVESNHDDDDSSVDHMHTQETRTSNLLFKEEQQQNDSMSKTVDLDQKVIDLTQSDEQTVKAEILQEEVTLDATNSRTDTHALTQLCHTVVEKDSLIDELRRKLMEKHRLIITLQETDRFEI